MRIFVYDIRKEYYAICITNKYGIAVSYTHLDVYKRQEPDRLGICYYIVYYLIAEHLVK